VRIDATLTNLEARKIENGKITPGDTFKSKSSFGTNQPKDLDPALL